MIEDSNFTGDGWARFSDDRAFRYRLARALKLSAAGRLPPRMRDMADYLGFKRVTFVLLNPSTADAFKPDRTIDRCVAFSQRWGADILEVVNLFAFRSPHPDDLRGKTLAELGADETNDTEILAACRGARVIIGWGNGGKLLDRGLAVESMLRKAGTQLESLGRAPNGFSPLHPMARGKHRVPDDVEPQLW